MYKNDAVPVHRRRTPSFSSSLLDAIYRSIDDSNPAGDEKQSSYSHSTKDLFVEQRAVVFESWIDKRTTTSSVHSNSTSSCSSSRGGSSGGVFSSSSDDAEPGLKRRGSSSSISIPQRNGAVSEEKPKSEGGFSKTKLRAKKIYGELKKVKQPISPGGRIASFLNSIFSSGNGKKVKMCSIGAMDDVTTERKSKSACSSVTSLSRSCLSKTPARGKQSNNGGKRTVRFYPVSVIVGEDSRPCGHKSIYQDDPGLMEIKKFGDLKRDLSSGGRYIRHYQKKKIGEFDFRGFHSYEGEDEDSDDDESCSSSDLFELDHLIGIGRFREELPVYETTNLKTNQAIANGFIL